MRNFSIFLFCIIFSCTSKKGPLISYKSRIINLGNIEFKKSFTGKILIRNTGDETLKLREVTADCSCTVPNIQNKRIFPGDSAYIQFVLTPTDDGFIQQSIYLDNNSSNENRVLFLIRAKVNLLNH
jgi:hypothetical protein